MDGPLRRPLATPPASVARSAPHPVVVRKAMWPLGDIDPADFSCLSSPVRSRAALIVPREGARQ
jgi:hypothetical protein